MSIRMETIARYKQALEKISSYPLQLDDDEKEDYEGAYWDIVLEADSALYPDEYSRKDGRDEYTKNAHLPSGRYSRANLTSIELARKDKHNGMDETSKDS